MSARICLVTTGQPSTDPRLVKEADALAAQGYDVHVVGAHWADWAAETDRRLLETRKWSAHVIDWRLGSAPLLFWKTRARHAAGRVLAQSGNRRRTVLEAASSRLTPELAEAARDWPASLYIAHNLGALPAAARAAAHHRAKLGFDAEDFHAGQLSDADPTRSIHEAIEARYIPMCDYVTAASPGTGAAYARLSRRPPTVVLNVFTLSDRPPAPNSKRSGPFRLYWFSQTIGPHRGLEQAVHAIGLLPDLHVELHLRGSWAAGYHSSLASLAERAGLPANRIVSHAPSAPNDMIREAALFDAGLSLETGETENANVALGNKLFTYILAGLPLVATGTRAHTELAASCGPAMQLVPPGDASALAFAIRRWHDAPQLLDAARRAAWTLGTERYNWDRERETFLSVVREVLGETPLAHARFRGLAS